MATLAGHTAGVLAVAASPRGGLVASAGADSSVKVWDVRAREAAATLSPHSHPVNALAYSSSGHLLASADEAGAVCLHRATS